MATPYAFVTLVSSDSYLPGALALVAALKDTHSKPPVPPEVDFQTVCLVTPETVDVSSIKLLRKSYDLVVGVEVIEQGDVKGLQLLGRLDLNSVLTKLHIFRLTQYSKLIFLDADVLPIRPLSHLFTLPHEFSAVPDVGWPDIFNSGVMVLSPGEDKFRQLVELLRRKGSWDGGDQGLLNEWRGSNWHRLSFTYNTTPTAAYTYAPAYERFGSYISAIHFIGPNKPWRSLPWRAPLQKVAEQPPMGPNQTYDYSSLLDRWFEVYDRHYRVDTPASKTVFEVQRYSSVWDDVALPAGGGFQSSVTTPLGGVLGLDDLRRIATEGYNSMDTGGHILTHSSIPAEGEYRTMPLEGRVDLMRPQKVPHPLVAGEQEPDSYDSVDTSQQRHIDLPTGIQQMRMYTLPTPRPNEIPPAPYHHDHSLPPSETPTPYYGPSSVEYREARATPLVPDEYSLMQPESAVQFHSSQPGFYDSDQYSSGSESRTLQSPQTDLHRPRHTGSSPLQHSHSHPHHVTSPHDHHHGDVSGGYHVPSPPAVTSSQPGSQALESPKDRGGGRPPRSPPHTRRDTNQIGNQAVPHDRIVESGQSTLWGSQRYPRAPFTQNSQQQHYHRPSSHHVPPIHLHSEHPEQQQIQQYHSPEQRDSPMQHSPLKNHTLTHHRSPSPPKVTWNPAVEPPPNHPPPLSAFPTDTYFPNVWDQPPSQDNDAAHQSFSPDPSTPSRKSPEVFFHPPPPSVIPEQLLREGQYANVLGQITVEQFPGSPSSVPTPDRNKVKSIFPWEDKPRHIPKRVFPTSDTPPAHEFIEETKTSPPRQKAVDHERPQLQLQTHSPPGGFPPQLSFANAWDTVPSIQKYATKLLTPRQLSSTLPQAPDNSWRKWDRKEKEREKWQERQDASSMDGDDEDDGDSDDGEGSRTGRQRRPRASSSASAPNKGKKEYRMRGVQTANPEMLSKAVQVTILREDGKIRLRSESAGAGTKTKTSVGVGGGSPGGLGIRREWPSPSSTPSLLPSAVPRNFNAETEQVAGTPSINVNVRSSMPFPSSASPSGLRSPQTLGSPRTYSPPKVTSPPKVSSPPSVTSPNLASPRPSSSHRTHASGALPRLTSPLQSTPASGASASQQITSPRLVRSTSTSTPPLRPDSPVASRAQTSTPPPRLLPKLSSPFSPQMARSISAETNATLSPSTTQSSLATPENTPVVSVRKGGRVWDPSRGVDVFKRGSEEVLARFLRMGSFEEGESQSQKHHVS